MSKSATLPRETVHDIRSRCLCLATQRAARLMARRFDRLFAPLGLTNGQFSMMIALSSGRSWRMKELAEFLAMDSTTLSTAARTLQQRGLLELVVDEADARARRPALTEAGRQRVAQAVPLWQAEHARIDAELSACGDIDPAALARGLGRIG